jgi:hypothetical protein
MPDPERPMMDKARIARQRRGKRLELDETFAIVADLLLANRKVDARERRFLQRSGVDFNIRARVANQVIEAMLVKNHLSKR